MINIGTVLQDRFLIEEQIGVGGMGAVYRATDQKFGSTVAIKETFYRDKDLAEAFEREARLLNGLHHPLFPHVSDHFTEGEGHFLVMEYIEGQDLSELLKQGEQLSIDTVMRWTLDLLDGLDYLHSQDPPIIHRDIKPSNLRLTSRGNIMLLDFGMAKETSGDTQGMRSVFGYSRRYSPLEQIEGTGTDVRSDIFSLGATIYHLLTGTPPVDVLRRASAIVAGRPDPFQPASSVNPEVPERTGAIIDSAMALNPDSRFVSARAMWSALEHSLDGGRWAPTAPATLPNFAAPIAATPLPASAFTAPEEKFPALEAFEADAEAPTGDAVSAFWAADDGNDPIAASIAHRMAEMRAADGGYHAEIPPQNPQRIEVPVISDPEPFDDFKQEPVFDDFTEEEPVLVRVPQGDLYALPTPVAQPASSAYGYNRAALIGIPLILLILGLAGFALLRSGSDQQETVTVPETPAEQITQPVASPQTSVAPVPEQEDLTAVALNPISEDAEDDVLVEEPETKAKPNARTSVLPRADAPAVERAPSTRTAVPAERPTEPARAQARNQEPANNRNNRSTRPRVLREEDFNQPPVSSIESIMTGIPSERRGRRWEVWEEDQLRRERRIRRMNRRNRQRDPFF